MVSVLVNSDSALHNFICAVSSMDAKEKLIGIEIVIYFVFPLNLSCPLPFLLAGTREIWIKQKETESVLRKLVDTENKVHSMVVSSMIVWERQWLLG